MTDDKNNNSVNKVTITTATMIVLAKCNGDKGTDNDNDTLSAMTTTVMMKITAELMMVTTTMIMITVMLVR